MIKRILLTVIIAASLLSKGSLLSQQTQSLPAAANASVPRRALIESYRRQDWTGRGTFHRLGMLEEQQSSLGLAEDAGLLNAAVAGAADESQAVALSDMLTLQVNVRSMFFGSDNIFNVETGRERGGQFAQFAGLQLDVQFDEHWKLTTSYDHAWFWHLKHEHAGQDFITSTTRQALSYDRFIFNNKASISIPLSWQYSALFNRASGDHLLDTWQYGTGLEFSWFAKPWLIPTFSYLYFWQASDLGGPVDKHKHDFNLGLTFIPFKDKKFFVIPSVQYSHEDFARIGRADDAWTPTLTASWQPLKWLAVDLVGSYTDSRSDTPGASFKAMTGTAFIRLFWTR